MGVVSIEVDEAQRRFLIAVTENGAGNARRAMSRALNHEGAKLLTSIRRVLVAETSIPRPTVTGNVRPIRATRNRLEYTIRGFGKAPIAASSWSRRRSRARPTRCWT